MTQTSENSNVSVPRDNDASRSAVIEPKEGHTTKRSRAISWAMFFFAFVYVGITLAQSDVLKFGLTPVHGKPTAYELDLPGLDGKQYRLYEYRGKVVIVNFWATWCPPCIKEMPKLQQVWELFQHQNFEVLAVNLGEDDETIRRFLDRFEPKLGFPILLASDEAVMATWRIVGLPVSYVVDPAGRLVYREVGPRDFSHEHIVSRLRKLMTGDD